MNKLLITCGKKKCGRYFNLPSQPVFLPPLPSQSLSDPSFSGAKIEHILVGSNLFSLFFMELSNSFSMIGHC